MNTKGSGTDSWFGPKIASQDIPKSGTDNRRNHSDEVEELQLRAHECTRQQLQQINDWDRAS